MPALRQTALLAAAAMLLAAPAWAADPITVDRSFVYYDIAGNTAAEIAQSIRDNRPPETAGFVGLTAFTFAWTYNYAPATDPAGKPDCQVSDAAVTIKIITYLPRHPTIRQAPDAIARQWKTYSVALKRHETHHGDDFDVIGSAIPAAIDAVHTPTCATIEAVGNAVGNDYVVRAQAKGDDYDAITDHGMNDGAMWPGL